MGSCWWLLAMAGAGEHVIVWLSRPVRSRLLFFPHSSHRIHSSSRLLSLSLSVAFGSRVSTLPSRIRKINMQAKKQPGFAAASYRASNLHLPSHRVAPLSCSNAMPSMIVYSVLRTGHGDPAALRCKREKSLLLIPRHMSRFAFSSTPSPCTRKPRPTVYQPTFSGTGDAAVDHRRQKVTGVASTAGPQACKGTV